MSSAKLIKGITNCSVSLCTFILCTAHQMIPKGVTRVPTKGTRREGGGVGGTKGDAQMPPKKCNGDFIREMEMQGGGGGKSSQCRSLCRGLLGNKSAGISHGYLVGI